MFIINNCKFCRSISDNLYAFTITLVSIFIPATIINGLIVRISINSFSNLTKTDSIGLYSCSIIVFEVNGIISISYVRGLFRYHETYQPHIL